MLKYFINLDRSKERLQKISSRLQELELDFQRMPAVEGKALNSDFLASLQYKKNDVEVRSRYTRQLTPAEIGTFLSHKKCWQALIESNEQYVVILEDDLIISDRATYFLRDSHWIPKNVDILRLVCFDLEKEHTIENKQINLNCDRNLVVQLIPKPIGCQGYILSRAAAQFALEQSNKLPAPVDDFLFTLMFPVANKFKCWQLNPCIVKADPALESDIGSRAKNSIQDLKAPFWIRHGLKRYLLKKRISKIQSNGIKAKLYFK